jgi:TPP-dependent pyruvate/acetoin dehydrogenase alpha subunit
MSNSMVNFRKEDILLLYRNMVRGRKYDEALVEMCRKSVMPGMWHSGIGHEAVGAGIASFLRNKDWLGITHRGVTAGLAKGLDARMWLAESLGRSGGYCKGKSRKSIDSKVGVLPGGGTIGSCFPIATGAAIAANHAGKGQVVVCLFGDGAAQRGTLHECMNMAAVWNLPVIWVCENNRYSITTHASKVLAVENISDFAHSYSMPGITVDGMDVIAVAVATIEAMERARNGKGPSLIECKTYRFREHGEFDIDTSYRSKDEVERWRKRDPIELFRERLLDEGVASTEELEAIDDEMEEEVEAAAEWALASPFPEADEALTDLFAE